MPKKQSTKTKATRKNRRPIQKKGFSGFRRTKYRLLQPGRLFLLNSVLYFKSKLKDQAGVPISFEFETGNTWDLPQRRNNVQECVIMPVELE